MGKSTGKDERDSKATFVTHLGLLGATKRLEEEVKCIKVILKRFKEQGFNTDNYETLTDFLINRDR